MVMNLVRTNSVNPTYVFYNSHSLRANVLMKVQISRENGFILDTISACKDGYRRLCYLL